MRECSRHNYIIKEEEEVYFLWCRVLGEFLSMNIQRTASFNDDDDDEEKEKDDDQVHKKG